MNLTPEWVSAICAIVAVAVSIVALFKANGASSKVNNIMAQNAAEIKMGAQTIKGDGNRTATGSGNQVS